MVSFYPIRRQRVSTISVLCTTQQFGGVLRYASEA
jgi:hypothetical protein